MYSPVPRAREASALPRGGGRAVRRVGWWARAAGFGLVVALLGGGGGRAAPAIRVVTEPPLLQAGRLVAEDGQNKEHFGFAVAVDQNTLAVGASNAKIGSHRNQGAVYVYVRVDSGWALQQKLTVADGADDDQLGYAVALRGDVLVAGAPFSRVGGDLKQGAAYVFRRTGTRWVQESTVTGPSGDNGDRFGWALDLSGSTLAVGAPYEEQPSLNRTGLTDSGVVHLYTDPGAGAPRWTETSRLIASDADSDDTFGVSVALDGDRLLVGAPSRDATAEDDGAVYAFARSGADWIERELLTAATPAGGDYFGTAVAIDGDDAVVGIPGRDGARRDQGAAFAFAYAAGGWVRAQKLAVPAGAEENDAQFGAAVALDAGTIAVGTPRSSAPEGNQGLVYTFTGNDGAWTPRQTLLVRESSRGSHVGAAVAVAGSTVFAGAPDDDIETKNKQVNPKQGSVTAFDEFVAADDAYAVDQDRTLTVSAPGVLANDTNPTGGLITATLASGPAHGTLALNDDGSFTYVPAADFSGADAFSYHAQLGSASSSRATVTITVRPRPTAVADAYSAREDTPLTVTAANGVLANDTSGTGNPLTARLVSGPAHGTLTLNADGSFTYSPAAGYSGADTFTYVANDRALDSSPATVTLTVTPKPPPPSANPDAYSTEQGATLTVTAPDGVLANDFSPSDAPLSAAAAAGPEHGTLTLNADGSFTYTPATGYTGPDTFSYTASDGVSDSAVAPVSLTVTPPPPPPTAIPDDYSVDQDTTLTVTVPEGVLANDTSNTGEALTAASVSGPAHGALTLSANGSFSYTPAAGYSGPDTFRYRASDEAGSAQADVTIDVQPPPVGIPPIAQDDDYSTDQDTPLTVTAATGVLANDTGSTLTASVLTGPAHGTLALNADGSFLYTPTAGYNGPDTFTYAAANGAGSAPGTATLTVQSPPVPPPTANADNYSTDQDTPLTVTAADGVLANDDGASLTATVVTGPQHGTLALNADGSFLYTPTAGYNGPDAFTYAATNSADSAQAIATLAVIPPALPPPAAADDAYDTVTGTPLTVAATTGVLANDTGAVAAVVVAGPTHGTLTLNADGSFTYAPEGGYAGPDTFSYEARNAAGADLAAVALVVHPEPNHPPAVGDDTFTTTQDTPLVITAAQVLTDDSDPDGDQLSFVSLTDPDHGRLTVVTGRATYTPDAGFSGTDTFTYAVSDGRDSSPPARVTVTVTAAAPPEVDAGGEVIIVPPPQGGGVPPGPTIPVAPGHGLRDCNVRVETAAAGADRRLLAQGRTERTLTRRVAVKTQLTRDGVRALRNTVGGVSVRVRAICRAPQREVLGDVAHRLALLRVQRAVTPPGSWVPNRAVLTALGERYVRALARRLRPLAVARLRCDGHTAIAPASPVDPLALSRRRAQLVCGRLRSLTARRTIVAHGGNVPIATNATEEGRAANRRAAITITYRRARGGRAARVGSGVLDRPWSPPTAPAIPRGQTPQGA